MSDAHLISSGGLTDRSAMIERIQLDLILINYLATVESTSETWIGPEVTDDGVGIWVLSDSKFLAGITALLAVTHAEGLLFTHGAPAFLAV
jgi:hypothetical protein